ncbi:MAG: WD40 repeat domain-containing protein [Pseudodesulfovibrio sp.]
MGRISEWDWEVGQKTVVTSISPLKGHEWQEEPYVSPDGETMAAVVNLGDGEFSVRTNDTIWETPFEKVWYPRFSPDGRLTALCQQEMEWALGVDGELVGDTCEYVWETKFSASGSTIATMAKSEERYGVSLNGVLWENLYANANQYSISNNGVHTVAVVQVTPLGQADIAGFKKGIYSLAIDGDTWAGKYLNLWTPTFDNRGLRVAAQARTDVHKYTIVVDDEPWPNTFTQVWTPIFHPEGQYVAAPVRVAGKWGVARDGALLWKARYVQCMKLQFSADGNRLWGIVAPKYGRFTVACNDKPWSSTFPVVTDLVLSPNGQRAGVIASNNNAQFRIVVDDTAWHGTWDMAWPVAFSSDNKHVAALVEKGGQFHILVNGNSYERSFDRAWPPVFSEDGSKVLIRAIDNNSYVRIVADVAQF